MKHYKTQTEEKQVLERTTCDICEKELEQTHSGFSGGHIEHRKGQIYHDGGGGWYGTKIDADFCSNCFHNKVTPALENVGVVFQAQTDSFPEKGV